MSLTKRGCPGGLAAVAALFVCLFFPQPVEAGLAPLSPLADPPLHPVLFPDFPGEEVTLSEGVATMGSVDMRTAILTDGGNKVAVVTLEDFQLKVALSTDGGLTFAPEVVIGGEPSGHSIHYFDVAHSPEGYDYLLLLVADPQGGLGLEVLKTTDHGTTWNTPRPALQWSSTVFGAQLESSKLGAGSGGRLAILFIHSLSGDPYVTASSNDGLTWTGAVRISPQIPAGESDAQLGSIAVGSDNTIHAAYTAFYPQENDTATVYYTRSTDGGLTFSTPRTFNDLLGPLPDISFYQYWPEIGVMADGSVLVAFSHAVYDNNTGLTPGQLAIFRSTDYGLNYSLSTLATLSADDQAYGYFSLIKQHPVTGTVLVGAVNSNLTRPVWVLRSTDSGASFATPQGIPGMNSSVTSFYFAAATGSPDRWAVGARALVSLSRDDGVTWETAQSTNGWLRADQLAFVGGDNLSTAAIAVPTGMENGVYLRRTPSNPFNLNVADQRVDQDRTQVMVAHGSVLAFTSDGVNQAYAAFSATPSWQPTVIYVTAIADAGRSVDVPVPVSTNFGNLLGPNLALKALPNGHVFLAFITNNSFTVRFNRSLNYGVTWQGSDLLLTSTNVNRTDLRLEADDSGCIVITWLENQHIMMARSSDGGVSFTYPATIDQSPQVLSSTSRLCSAGSVIFMAYKDSTCEGEACYLWERHSDDGGASWSPRKGMIEDSEVNISNMISLACNPSGDAAIGWLEEDEGSFHDLMVRRFRSSEWDAPVLAHHFDKPMGTLQLLFNRPENLLAFAGDGTNVFSQRSADGGTTFAEPVVLDATAPLPEAGSIFSGLNNPRAAADAAGHIWAAWMDASPSGVRSYGAIAVACSTDDGNTWSTPERVNQELPQGNRGNATITAVSLPGGGLINIWGQRVSFNRYSIVASHEINDFDDDGSIDRRDNCPDFANPFQTDLDGDGLGAAPGTICDCDDGNASRHQGLHEVCDDGIDNNCDLLIDAADQECGFPGERLVDFAPIHGIREAGYIHDDGRPYAPVNGHGWLIPVDSRLNTRHRFCPGLSVKERTLVLAEEASAWEIDIPNGDYLVTVAVGDCTQARGPHYVDIEGVTVVDGETTAAGSSLLRQGDVTVSDGKLTMEAGGGGGVTALQYMTVRTGWSALRVNFQPESSVIPSGYLPDWGMAYDGSRRYGWSASLVGSGVERNLNPDQRLDTLLLVSSGPYTWQANVSRQYQTVTVSVGDPQAAQGPHVVSVEGVPLFNGEMTAAGQFLQRSVELAVPDGVLTMSVGSPGGVTAIDYVDIVAFGSGEVCDLIDNDGNGVADEGCDQDGDGYCNPSKVIHPLHNPCAKGLNDCEDTKGAVWAVPGEVRNLEIFDDTTTLLWSRPLDPGGLWSAVVYDTIRAADPRGFENAGFCVESNDGSNRNASDDEAPAPGTGFFYLVRAENACPLGMGTLGRTSTGQERQGRPCP